MSLQEFHKPSRGYKQVKAERISLPDRTGADKLHSVMVYMSTSGTPHFAIGVPQDYANAWEKHRDKEFDMSFHDRLYVLDGAITAPSFDAVLKHIVTIGHNFQRHIRNLTMNKVIRLVLEIKGASEHKSHNAPSFSDTRVLVGIRSGIYWEVNGGYYVWDGRRRDGKLPHMDDCADEDPGEPSYRDLTPADMRGNPITIPFTPEAWQTVQQVEGMLQRAGDMLLGLANPETAVALLQGGFQTLLAAPKEDGRAQ